MGKRKKCELEWGKEKEKCPRIKAISKNRTMTRDAIKIGTRAISKEDFDKNET